MVPAAILLLVFLPGLAFAAQRRTYFGPAAGGVNNAGVEISARLTSGSPTTLTKFEWHNVPAACAGSRPTATTGEFSGAIKVRNGKFDAKGNMSGGRATVNVRGRFKSSNRKMAGTLRVRGPVAGCAAVDTRTVSWTAKQPAGQR